MKKLVRELRKRLNKEKPSFGVELFYIDGIKILAEYYQKYDGTYNIEYVSK